jgi:endo-1,4-beta-xylanase
VLDSQQLQIYQSQFPVFWQAEYLRGITIWGWIYNESTAAPYSGLVRDGASRPAMKWLMDFLGRPLP